MTKDEALKYYATKQHMTIDGTENGEIARKALACKDEYTAMLELNNKFKDDAIAQLQLDNDKLHKKAMAVVDRWNSPLWKDLPHTAKYIHELNEALSTTSQSNSVVKESLTTQKPLSDEELLTILKSVAIGASRVPQGYKMFARAIEKAHGIK